MIGICGRRFYIHQTGAKYHADCEDTCPCVTVLDNLKTVSMLEQTMSLTKSQSIKIWGAGTSRTLRPIWVAEEIGLEYELMPIAPRSGETKTEAFTDLNRKQKIPLLVDGG